jgi:WD40 repeat protein
MRTDLVRFSLDGTEQRVLTSHGRSCWTAAVNPAGDLIATGSDDGIVRIGPGSDGEPHYLFGHEEAVMKVAFSPDGRWLASGGGDGTIRLWPVPEPSRRPFQTLRYRDVLDRLRGLTNLRVMADESSPQGYRLKIDPFPGWATTPDW